MKKLLEGRTLLALFLLGLSLYFVVAGYGYGRHSRLFPIAIGLPTVFLLVLVLVSVWKPRVLRRADVDLGGELGEPRRLETEEEEASSGGALDVWRMIGWLLFANAGVALVGFRVTVPLFVTLFARLEGKARWSLSIFVAAISWAFMVGYFDLVMELRMFKGILFGDLLPLF